MFKGSSVRDISPQSHEQTLYISTLVVVRNILNARVRDEMHVEWLMVLVGLATHHHQAGEAHKIL